MAGGRIKLFSEHGLDFIGDLFVVHHFLVCKINSEVHDLSIFLVNLVLKLGKFPTIAEISDIRINSTIHLIKRKLSLRNLMVFG